jgi:hypothetical protein
MLKRTTKVKSLLVVAASIVSMIPAMAADIKKIAAEEGTVYGAKSNADGTFYIDAEINGADEAIYSYKDGKYTKVNGADAGDTIGDVVSYDGKNYLQMNDGSYYVDLKTGETTDDDIIANIDDDAATALRKNIKADNDGRFDETLVKDLHTADDKVRNIGDGAGNIVAGQKTMFGITGKWRQYFYELKTSDLDGKATSTVYSDDKGNYIDVDYNVGKVGVVSTTYGAVTIENTKDTYESTVNGTTYEMKATIANNVTWDEGPVYITRTANLKIWGRVKTSNDSNSYADITNKVSFGSKNNKHAAPTFDGDGSVTVLQRISKAQASDDVDGIKYAKDVKTYFITDADGKADGTKATAWLQDGTTWYYLNVAGVMQTGWINDNGTWYYCNGSGAMLANTTVDGYVLGASGAWAK